MKIAWHRNHALLASLLSGFITCPAAGLAADCSFEKAVYSPIENDSYSVIENYEMTHTHKKGRNAKGKLVATIQGIAGASSVKNKAYEFAYVFQQGYARTRLVLAVQKSMNASSDPANDDQTGVRPGSSITFFDHELKEVDPFSGDIHPSPAFLIMPDIAIRFWYWGGGDRQFVPSGGIWKRVRCRE
jgi:hypothetical protein